MAQPSHASTWTLSRLPEGHKAIPCKWVFATKYNHLSEPVRYKARLVAKGYTQISGIDGRFAYATGSSTVAEIQGLEASLPLPPPLSFPFRLPFRLPFRFHLPLPLCLPLSLLPFFSVCSEAQSESFAFRLERRSVEWKVLEKHKSNQSAVFWGDFFNTSKVPLMFILASFIIFISF